MTYLNPIQTFKIYHEGYKLQHCLRQCYGVDKQTAFLIKEKFTPLLKDLSKHPLVDDFIEKSQKLNIDFPLNKKNPSIHAMDGTLQAPEQHEVIFDSPYVRIFWSTSKPGCYEPLHMHEWKSLMVLLNPAKYEINYANGTKEIADLKEGIYELPAEEFYDCKNIGSTDEAALRFEVKN